jgi:hypothetical protein
MTARKLTEKVRKLAKSKGAELVGFASMDRFGESPRMMHPESHLPEARTVISVAIHYGNAAVERAGKEPAETLDPMWCSDHVLNARLMEAAYDVASYLESEGFPSLPFLPTQNWRVRPYKEIRTTHTSCLSHRHAAVAAGLGEFGLSGNVLTPEYGPRQRFNSIITTAALEPTPLYDGKPLCDNCMLCFKGCHEKCLGAMTREKIEISIGSKKCVYFKIDKWRCSWAEQFRLCGNAGAKHYGMSPDMPVPEKVSDKYPEEAERIVREAMKDWDSVQRYVGVATIGNCLQDCKPPCLRKKTPAKSSPDTNRAKGSRRPIARTKKGETLKHA